MRVLHLITTLNRGGIERWVLQMLERGPSLGIHSDVCCRKERGAWAEKAEALGANVFVIHFGPLHVSYGKKLRQLLRQGAYDLVHCHLGSYSGYPVYLAHREGLPIITTFHNTDLPPQEPWLKGVLASRVRSLYSKQSIRYAVRRCEQVVCVSAVVADRVASDNHAARGRVRVIYHGVEVPPLASEDDRARFRGSLGWGDKDVLVLHVGRFDEQKNHEAVVTMFHRVIQQKSYARLVMVGDGPLRPIIERRVKELGLEDKARFLGYRDDVPAIMSVSDVFVFPSINEGFGIVAIEAAAAGLPVVASRVPGLTEVVRHKETGVLCDLHDIAGMVEAVKTLIEDESMRSQMGAAGRQWVSENFSEEHMVQEYLDVYTDVLDRWRRGKSIKSR